MASSDQILIRVSDPPLQVASRTIRGPSSFITKTYDKLGKRLEHAIGKAFTNRKIGPDFPTKDIENALGDDPDLKLKRLCDLYAFYGQNQPSSPEVDRYDWKITEIAIYCSQLLRYASPDKSVKTQLDTFRNIVRLTTSYPGLRLAFLRDDSLHNINVDTIWKYPDDDVMDEEWRLFRHLAASCIGNRQVIRVLEGVTPRDFGTFYHHSEGTVEQFLAIAVDTVLTDDVQRITATRYLGGILQMHSFWRENDNQGMPGEKLLEGSKVLVENLGLDPPVPNRSRNLCPVEVEGIDLLVEAVLVGVNNWARCIPPPQDARWLILAFKLMDAIDGIEAARFLHRSTLAMKLKAEALQRCRFLVEGETVQVLRCMEVTRPIIATPNNSELEDGQAATPNIPIFVDSQLEDTPAAAPNTLFNGTPPPSDVGPETLISGEEDEMARPPATHVRYSFDGDGEGELPISSGTQVVILDDRDPEWWYVRDPNTGREGVVPARYLY